MSLSSLNNLISKEIFRLLGHVIAFGAYFSQTIVLIGPAYFGKLSNDKERLQWAWNYKLCTDSITSFKVIFSQWRTILLPIFFNPHRRRDCSSNKGSQVVRGWNKVAQRNCGGKKRAAGGVPSVKKEFRRGTFSHAQKVSLDSEGDHWKPVDFFNYWLPGAVMNWPPGNLTFLKPWNCKNFQRKVKSLNYPIQPETVG